MNTTFAAKRYCILAIVLGSVCGRQFTAAQTAPPAQSRERSSVIDRIRDEGLNHSQAMQTLSYLTDVIGPRLTGSPNLKRANEWTRDTLEKWGLENAHLEAWGPFGRGWTLKRFSIQIVEPQAIILIAYPKAWSPGFDEPFIAPVVWVDARTEADLEKYAGKLKGAVVLAGAERPVEARFEPLARRDTDSELLSLADATAGSNAPFEPARAGNAAAGTTQIANSPTGQRRTRRGAASRPATDDTPARAEGGQVAQQPTDAGGGGGAGGPNGPGGPGRPGGRGRGAGRFTGRILAFAAKEGAAMVIDPSARADGGTVFVAGASVPAAAGDAPFDPNRPRVYAVDCPPIPAQATMAVEEYNRLIRMIKQGEELKMAVDLQVQYHSDDLMAYNTIAEIPGTDDDLQDQIVMAGGHMDSWQAGTGATDNGVGVVVAMEAVRILRALHLKPRRTIRVGLWTGEEQGLLGSRAYVTKHFGSYPGGRGLSGGGGGPRRSEDGDEPATRPTLRNRGDATDDTETAQGDVARVPARRDRGGRNAGAQANRPASRPSRTLVKGPDYEKLSVYFNLDNGTGKIRGVYMQGNEAARPYFRQWLNPFADLGATTLTPSNTGSTDHTSFDGIGLPGFQFIQDPIEYNSRTHHSSADVYDRIQADDVKQASTIMAAFLYDAAQMDERFPRKPLR